MVQAYCVKCKSKKEMKASKAITMKNGNPATQTDVEKKVMHYASKVLGKDRTRKVIITVNNLDSLPNLNELGNMLRI
jgi:hypothetical protein